MDINRLCPGCMREVDGGIQKMKIQGEAPQNRGSGEAQNQRKCPHCGFCADTYKQNARCLPINTILAGKYLVGAVLGEGGFGITYIGYDLNMQTRIAIKEYFPVELVSRDTTSMTGDRVISMSGDKSATYRQGLKKYVAEAQNISQFSEIPGVVSVKDFFYENETAYIVMEYIDGISLKDYLKERGGRLSEKESLAIMRPVLDALVKVHEAGIIHRDISPDNIMITRRNMRNAEFAAGNSNDAGTGADGNNYGTERHDTGDMLSGIPAANNILSVKLIDFGAARMTAKNDQKSLTIILKHGYAPEEQYRTHGEQGPWTDVYAVCAVLYRMLTGQTPVPAMDRMFQDELKSFKDLNTKVSRNTQAAILKGLAVKKEDRLQTVTELMQVLYEGGKTQAGEKNRIPLIGVLSVGVLIIGAAALLGIVFAGKRAEMPQGEGSAQIISNNQDSIEDLADSTGEMSDDILGEDAFVEVSASIEVETLDMEQEDEEIGEVIVEPCSQTSFAGSSCHAIARLEDGTVTSAGSNQYGQRNLAEWNRIAAVAAGDTFSAGLRLDGKVIVAGELDGKEDVERWEGILAIAGCDSHLYSLTAEGTVVANVIDYLNEDCMEWTDVKAISAGPYTVSALTQDGQVLAAEGSAHAAAQITGWEDVRWIVCNQNEAYGIREDGNVVAVELWADVGYATLRHEEWKDFRDIVQLYALPGGVYGVDTNGELHVSVNGGENRFKEVSAWTNLEGVAGTVWENRMIGLQKDGTILKAATNYGNAEMTDMTGLKKVMERKGSLEGISLLIGITQDSRLLYYGYTDATRLDEVPSAEDVYIMDWWQAENQVHSTCAYLDSKGNLWMEQGEKEYNDIQIVDSSIRQIIPVCLKHGSYIAGLHENGSVMLYKSGIYDVPEELHAVENWSNVKQIAGKGIRDGQYMLLGLMEDGSVKAVHSDGGFEGSVDDWTDIRSLYSGDYSVGAIKADGTAVFLEDASEYNYGQYNTFGWTDLTQLALGLYHTAGLREDGTVYAVGRNDTGQCEVEDWTDIVYIAATECATLGIRSDGTLVIAGEVGW